MNMKRNKKGQSTVEYVIVFTAIAAAVIFAAINVLKPAVGNTYSQAISSVNASGGYFTKSIGMGKFNVN